ncbi:MAG: DNA methyltransferase [Polyangiaceae bacterium]
MTKPNATSGAARVLERLARRSGIAEALGDVDPRAASEALLRVALGVAFDAMESAADGLPAVGALCEASLGLAIRRVEGRLEVARTDARRTTGTHYTPHDLAARVVARGLAPLLARRGRPPTSEEILALRVLDPSVGAGAFLLAALDHLAEALHAAWMREGAKGALDAARREVAARCLFGIDKSPVAAAVARRSVALASGLRGAAARALEGRIVCRDALVDRLPAGFTAFDAVVGNPPFLGGKRISTELGAAYAAALHARHGTSKNADLSAHFVRRAGALAGGAATISFVTTNSLAEGDTRRAGLAVMLAAEGWTLYEATRSAPWPGDAAVFVSIVHLARGLALPAPRLDGREVPSIDSSLRVGRERVEPARLGASQRICFIGCFLRGKGFVLDAREARRIAEGAEEDLSPLRPFLGGEEVGASPTQSPHRFVIDLAHLGEGTCTLGEAAQHPRLLAHLERTVKPERLALPVGGANDAHRARWWLFANTRPELRRALAGLARCLVLPRLSRSIHVAWQPTDRVFSDQLCVFALDRDGHLALLQSRIHVAWARRHASTLGEGLRYTPSTCTETFPFPFGDPRITTAELDRAGAELDERRGRVLADLGVGLTALRRRLLDPRDRDSRLDALRACERRMEHAALESYGWMDLASELGSPSYDDRVIERLLALNASRAGAPNRPAEETDPRAESRALRR